MAVAPVLVVVDAQLIESERIEEYHKRHYTWPPKAEEYLPNTEGWKRIMERRFHQVERVPDTGDRYNGFMSTVHSALLCKNFTENGWGLTRAPQVLVDELVNVLHNGLRGNPREEHFTECIETENRPVMVDAGKLQGKALRMLKPVNEAWSGVKLVGNNAYGLRVYRNQSSLNMHIDKTESHIISCILHVDHDADSDPWPIVIEDFQGNLNEVVLESGDMLLYESSKCLHGRPRTFNGTWYSSLFIHYYPEGWKEEAKELNLETHYRVPESWSQAATPLTGSPDLLTVHDTSVKEPNCEDGWCALKDSLKWRGPGPEYGKVMSTGGVIETLDVPAEDIISGDEL